MIRVVFTLKISGSSSTHLFISQLFNFLHTYLRHRLPSRGLRDWEAWRPPFLAPPLRTRESPRVAEPSPRTAEIFWPSWHFYLRRVLYEWAPELGSSTSSAERIDKRRERVMMMTSTTCRRRSFWNAKERRHPLLVTEISKSPLLQLSLVYVQRMWCERGGMLCLARVCGHSLILWLEMCCVLMDLLTRTRGSQKPSS